jgi:flagellar protein FlaF
VYNHAAVNAYKKVDKATISGRETEARVLTEAALKLKKCQENWGRPDIDGQLDEALRYNQKIWSLFQGELEREDNPLPGKLKIDILRLAAFIDKRIFEVMAFPSPEKLNIIININQNIAAGLRGSPGPGA